jgi:hypothetical protein
MHRLFVSHRLEVVDVNVPIVRFLADLTRARAVRKAYTIVEARMGYRMIVNNNGTLSSLEARVD